MSSKTLLTKDFQTKEKYVRRFNKKDVTTLLNNLQSKSAEKDVENAWREFFVTAYVKHKTDANDKYVMTSPEKVDGLLVGNNLVFALKLLLEFKQKTDLDKAYDRARVTAQCVHYMKLLSDNEGIRPNVICGADERKAFVLYAPNFYDYLNKSYNWGCWPSEAYKEDPELMKDLLVDKNLSVWVYDFDIAKPKQAYIHLQELLDEIDKLAQNSGDEYQVDITESNIAGMFAEFKRIVLNKPDQVSAREAVTIFMKLLIGDNKDYYLHPNVYNKLHLPSGKLIDVDGTGLKTFFKHFNRRLKPSEQDHLLAMSDRLIQDETRRRKGDFWTPTIWANEADKLLGDTFGKDYKDTAIVWDCAAGTKNLTRDFVYENLYTSTIYQSEIDLGEKYNPEAKESFQYDFLNDDVDLDPTNTPDPNEWKMPNSLFNALLAASKSGKKIIFYTNPPYGTANNLGKFGTSKAKMAKNKMNDYMKANGYGSASQQLYAQFFARIIKLVDDFKLTNVGIGFFTKPRFFAGGDYWHKFNDKFFNKFKFVKGVMFNAGEFSDTADTWPIVFATYDLKQNEESNDEIVQFNLEKSVWNSIKSQMEIVPVNKNNLVKKMRLVYKPNDLSSWIREPIPKKIPEFDGPYPQLGSAMDESKGKKPRGKLLDKSLGYMVFNSNNVGEGTTNRGVWVVTSSAYKANGFNVLPENFERAVIGFAARRCVKPTWYNDQDNYKAPNIPETEYDEFVGDSLIFTLFDNGESYQAAYRNWNNYSNLPQGHGKWANEWFWLSLDQVRDWADEYDQLEVYDDTRGDKNRYVYNFLSNRKLSVEAQNVLNIVNKIVEVSFSDRKATIAADDSLCLEAWDAGWFQIRQMIDMFPDGKTTELMRDFKEKFEILRQKLEKAVYAYDMLI